MEKEEIIVDKPVEFNGLRIIPIVQVTAARFSGKRRISVYCTKKPLFVVIVTESYRKAFNVSGAEIPLDELIDAVPGLRERLL